MENSLEFYVKKATAEFAAAHVAGPQHTDDPAEVEPETNESQAEQEEADAGSGDADDRTAQSQESVAVPPD